MFENLQPKDHDLLKTDKCIKPGVSWWVFAVGLPTIVFVGAGVFGFADDYWKQLLASVAEIAGALILLAASWRSIKTRYMITTLELVIVNGQESGKDNKNNIAGFNKENKLKMLKHIWWESRLYLIAIALLCTGFLLEMAAELF